MTKTVNYRDAIDFFKTHQVSSVLVNQAKGVYICETNLPEEVVSSRFLPSDGRTALENAIIPPAINLERDSAGKPIGHVETERDVSILRGGSSHGSNESRKVETLVAPTQEGSSPSALAKSSNEKEKSNTQTATCNSEEVSDGGRQSILEEISSNIQTPSGRNNNETPEEPCLIICPQCQTLQRQDFCEICAPLSRARDNARLIRRDYAIKKQFQREEARLPYPND